MKSEVDDSQIMQKDLPDLSGVQESLGRLPYRVRYAQPEDASALYNLKVEVFGKTSLPYTIYQAPEAAGFLRHLIAEGLECGLHTFVLIEDSKQISGYYHALNRDADFFLNYIAVAEKSRGQAWGSFLLRHYEGTGRSSGFQQLALDVFEGNQIARYWYQRHGYRLHSVSFNARVSLNSIVDQSIALDCNDESWIQARQEEDRWGFSRIEFACGSGHLTVGLISNTICKLLHFDGVSIEQAVSAIAHTFRKQRETLILSSLPEIPRDLDLLSREKVLRLVKVLE